MASRGCGPAVPGLSHRGAVLLSGWRERGRPEPQRAGFPGIPARGRQPGHLEPGDCTRHPHAGRPTLPPLPSPLSAHLPPWGTNMSAKPCFLRDVLSFPSEGHTLMSEITSIYSEPNCLKSLWEVRANNKM